MRLKNILGFKYNKILIIKFLDINGVFVYNYSNYEMERYKNEY